MPHKKALIIGRHMLEESGHNEKGFDEKMGKMLVCVCLKFFPPIYFVNLQYDHA